MRDEERGAVLVLVLVLLVALTSLALSLGLRTRVELGATQARLDALRLRAMTDSAIELALAEVRQDQLQGDTLGDAWRDDQARFAGYAFGPGRVWLLCTEPDPGDGRELRYGLRDENGKLNVNVATQEQLELLPGMTAEAAAAILDWRDDDDDPLDGGAESDYYLSLEVPYQAKNGSIESLEELLRVRWIDEAVLYGEDRNRNGLLDPGEDDGDRSFPPDDADGVLDRGLIDYLTVFSRELNRTRDERPRLQWSEATPEDVAERLDGASPEVLFALSSMAGRGQVQSLGQLLVEGVTAEDAILILDEFTFSDQEILVGRINVNTAPREVLLGIPGLEEDDVEAIMSARLDVSQDLSSPGWLLNAIDLNKLRIVADIVTARSEQFTVHALAQLDDRPARFQRVEALIDRTFGPARILLWHDLTPLGFPLPGERGEELP
ncbi:MAG: type II secretion system protein GspK [Planctomycetota bacterium]